MKFTYPAIIRKTENGYKAMVPDLACCEATAPDMEDIMENIYEAVYDWIYTELQDDEGELPAVSDGSDLKTEPGDIVREICVNIRLTDGYDE